MGHENSHRRRVRTARAFLLALAASSALSQEPTPETLGDLTLEELLAVQLVSAPSRRAQLAKEAPTAVTVVTADEIRRHGYRTLADVLRMLPGFYVTDDRNYTYVGVRGFGLPGDYNTRVLLLVDGVRTNDNVYDESLVAREFVLDLAAVQRIEVSRGPGASVYGTSAFFAVVNVVTRRGRELDGGRVSAAGGSFGTWETKASYGRRLASGVEFAAVGSIFDSAGQTLFYPEFAAVNGGRVEGGDGEQAVKASASLAVGDLILDAAYSKRDKRIPTASYGTAFGDTRAKTRDEMLLLSAGYEKGFGTQFDFSAQVSFGDYAYAGAYPYVPSPTTDLFEDFTNGRWWGAVAQGTWRAGRHTLLFGTEYLHSLRLTQFGGDRAAPETAYDIEGEPDRRIALFAQDDWALGEKVRVSLGGRLDHYREISSRVNPRLALIVSPDSSTTLRALYGRAFRAPNEYEQSYYPVTDAHPDEVGLDAESIETVELTVERALGTDLRLVGSIHKSGIHQLITLVEDEHGHVSFENTDRLDTLGAELSLDLRLRRGLAGRFSYSVQDTDNPSGAAVPNSPRHMVQASLSIPLAQQRLWLSADARYMSQRLTPAGSNTDAYTVLDLTLFTERLPGGLEATASLFNAFDATWADPVSVEHVQAAIVQDGRHFRVQVGWRF